MQEHFFANGMSDERDDAMLYTRSLVFHPSIFNFVGNVFLSTNVKNKGVQFGKNDVLMSADSIEEHNTICKIVLENPDFFVSLIFKLLARNMFICSHNVICVSEDSTQQPIHCDLIACNPKKK